mgnify:CR=1 FL=1
MRRHLTACPEFGSERTRRIDPGASPKRSRGTGGERSLMAVPRPLARQRNRLKGRGDSREEARMIPWGMSSDTG